MSIPEIIDLCSDEETEVVEVEDVKPDIVLSSAQEKLYKSANTHRNSEGPALAQKSEGGKPRGVSDAVAGIYKQADRPQVLFDKLASAPPTSGSSTPPCRHFWRAGDYEIGQGFEPISGDGKNRLRVHPKFLHSNATSHKWAFGAIAELLDNAVDEIQKGATFVIVDLISIMGDGTPALLIQDDGGGMDPESLRSCMSFGFSDKNPNSSIGQYGNGFKTSTMRLGADAIVFSRCMNTRSSTQSVGLLSYTFLRQTGSDDIIVPMVDYELNPSSGIPTKLLRHGEQHFFSNLSAILKWSPFATEDDLLKQFDDIGQQGTKIIVFNLWFNDDGVLELDFDSDETDIIISGAPQMVETRNLVKKFTQKHMANQLRYSLRAYSSILYLHLPEYFRIVLRGREVRPHKLVSDLRFIECIKYTPNVAGNKEAIITTIGFLEGAPNLNIHGFNVYHKNRLILPFWRVLHNSDSKGRGVAGVLEANFIKPTHDKQDFEKSTIYFRLETRLKEMTVEYWDYHCHLVGYPSKKKIPQVPTQPAAPCQLPHSSVHSPINIENPTHLMQNRAPAPHISTGITGGSFHHPASLTGLLEDRQVVTTLHAPACLTPEEILQSHKASSQIGLLDKRRHEDRSTLDRSLKRQALGDGRGTVPEGNCKTKHGHAVGEHRKEIIIMMQENKSLHTVCLEYEKKERVLLAKAERLRSELEEVQCLYEKLSAEFKLLDEVKIEKS